MQAAAAPAPAPAVPAPAPVPAPVPAGRTPSSQPDPAAAHASRPAGADGSGLVSQADTFARPPYDGRGGPIEPPETALSPGSVPLAGSDQRETRRMPPQMLNDKRMTQLETLVALFEASVGQLDASRVDPRKSQDLKA